jgi:streptogramin lyase
MISDIAVDAVGNVYVASDERGIGGDGFSKGTIRKITNPGTSACIVKTLAGSCNSHAFNVPTGLTLDTAGNLYVVDANSTVGNYIYTGKISKVTPTGVVTTVATGLTLPQGIAIDSKDNLYVVDDGENIDKITPDGTVSTWVDWSTLMYTDDLSTTIGVLNGLAFDAHDNLYATDRANQSVRQITPNRKVTTLASGCSTSPSPWGNASWGNLPLNQACLGNPYGITVNASGVIYIADINGNVIRKIVPAQ